MKLDFAGILYLFAMTVKHLRELLDPDYDDLEVLVRPEVPGYELEAAEFRIARVVHTIERDTALNIIVIEADQRE